MHTLFNYKTPKKFEPAFKEFYVHANLKQVRTLSAVFFLISVSFRILSFIYYDELIKLPNFPSYSFINWTQMSGTFLLLMASSISLKFYPKNLIRNKIITLLFVVFLLLISFSISYTVSMNNTKNALTLFLIGIATVSLFFAIEYLEIAIIAICMILVYWLSMISAKISFDEKMTNFFAGFILGFILYTFSRYSYFFKSQHFVRLKQLEEKNLEVERLHIKQGEILGFVAHDLRNPLNNIEALSTLLLHDDAPKEELRLILSSAQQAKNIINDLIEAVKTEHSKLDTQSLNLNLFLTTIVEKWRTNSKREIILELGPNKVITYANASKLERVLDNLISNSIKFSSADKAICIYLKANKFIEVKVIDEGIGIPKDLLNYIFEQFSKAGRSGLHGEKSIGLGLHISQKIMEQHGGQLLVQSEENQGTTFTLVFPLIKF